MSYTKKVKATIDVEFELSGNNPNTLTHDELKKVLSKKYKYQILNAKQVVTVIKNKPILDVGTRMRNLYAKLGIASWQPKDFDKYYIQNSHDWSSDKYLLYIPVLDRVVKNNWPAASTTQFYRHSEQITKLVGDINILFSIKFDANNDAVLEFGPNKIFDAFGFPRPQVTKLNLPKIGTKQFTNEVSKLVEYFKDLISKVPGPTLVK